MNFFEQGSLLDDIGLAAFAALGADVVRVDITAAVGTEIGLGLDERARIGDHVDDALIEALAEIGLARNSVTPASRAETTRFFSECPVSMMIGT